MKEAILELGNGRSLSYAVYGAEEGRPVLYYHGTPSSRLEPLLLTIYGKDTEALLQQYGVQLIAVDRPGMGLSSFDENRTLASFAHDVYALLQHLQVSPCPLLCWSGGGPYALAMAHAHPEVIQQVGVIAGFSCSFGEADVYAQMGWNKMYFSTARKAPIVLHGMLEAVKRTKLHTSISQKLYELSNPDYALMKDVDALNALLDYTTRQACSKGTDGAVQEAQLYFEPYPFTLQNINTPVHFWWGTEDNVVTYIHAKAMERQLPNVTPHYYPGEGHLSVYVRCFEEALQVLTAT